MMFPSSVKIARTHLRLSGIGGGSVLASARFFWSGSSSLEARLPHDIEAERPVFIAQSNHRVFSVNRVFDLNHLILRGRDVRDVGYHEAWGHLLLDGYAGDRVLLLFKVATDGPTLKWLTPNRR